MHLTMFGYVSSNQGQIFWGVGTPQTFTSTLPKKYRNWHRLQTFALWQARFAFITQKSHQNVHKDLSRPKSIDDFLKEENLHPSCQIRIDPPLVLIKGCLERGNVFLILSMGGWSIGFL